MEMYNYSIKFRDVNGNEISSPACGSWHTEKEHAEIALAMKKKRMSSTRNEFLDGWIVKKEFETKTQFNGKLKRDKKGDATLGNIRLAKLMDDYCSTFYGNDIRITIEVLG